LTSKVSRLKIDNDLVLVNVFGVLLVIATVLFSESFVRTAIGLPFVLFFPGYVLICALFPKNKDLDDIERAALSIGLSIALIPLIGLILNYTPFGINLYPILVSLFFLTFLVSLATVYRRKSIPDKDRFTSFFSVFQLGKLTKTDKVLSVGLIVGVVVSWGIIANFASTSRERFTEFYVLGPSGKVEGYPTNLTLGETGTVIHGIVNHEYATVSYRVIIKLHNETVRTIESIRLGDEEKWEQNVTLTPNVVGEKLKLEFLLYMNEGANPYRSLNLWIVVNPS